MSACLPSLKNFPSSLNLCFGATSQLSTLEGTSQSWGTSPRSAHPFGNHPCDKLGNCPALSCIGVMMQVGRPLVSVTSLKVDN